MAFSDNPLDDRRRRECKHRANEQRRANWKSKGDGGSPKPKRTERHLSDAEPEGGGCVFSEVRELKVQADVEQQEHDTKFSKN